jgi:hypothetical protein
VRRYAALEELYKLQMLELDHDETDTWINDNNLKAAPQYEGYLVCSQ